ncbi:MAG: ribokinase [Actinobacteria bacterium HGW-Actinobacteria-2]|nr:MAG: ribokinase [Actinobacteria bacterium HGW-Actinobacteria-2]
MSAELIVLGSANMDLVVKLTRHPAPGETVFGDSLTTVAGGKGLNQAVAGARAGAPVRFVGAVGRDEFGQRLVAGLRAEGIDTTGVQQVDQPTGTAHISVDRAGQNSIVVVSGANASLTPQVLDGLEPGAAEWLLTQLEVPLDTVAAALDWCHHHGVRAVLTPAPVLTLDASLLAKVDLLVPNEFEACQLAGLDDPQQAALALSRSCRDVVVTLGSRGSVWATDGELRHRQPALTVAAVDTTAAGDTFVGLLVTQLSQGATMPQAMEWAAAGAAISVSRAGASASMPTRAEIDALLA